jgi:hypothetical protein
MRGIYPRAVVRKAALDAADHWSAEFQLRKEKWIQDVAQRQRGVFRKRPIGRALAEQCFEAGYFSDLPDECHGGAYWFEAHMLETAERLATQAERVEPHTIILEEREMTCLRPVLAEAEVKP